jgi:hypothetical protein
MLYIVFWFLQDFFQVFLSGFLPAADFFLLYLLFRAFDEEESKVLLIWAAFAGGLVWDLRWTGFIGFTSVLYILSILSAEWLWSFIPETGKTGFLLAFMIWIISVFGYVVRTFAHLYPGGSGLEAFVFQQLMALPALMFFGIYYSRKVAIDNA